MKKIALMASLLLCLNIFGQQEQSCNRLKYTNVSSNFTYSEPYYAGLSLEVGGFTDTEKNKRFPFRHSYIINVNYAEMVYDKKPLDLKGKGFVVDVGHRTYGGEREGSFFENSMSYGHINFDYKNSTGEKQKTTYKYFTMINPVWGYRFMLGKINFDPYVGFTWKWEVKNKGDFDPNPYFDNFVFKGGIRIGITTTNEKRF